MSHRSAAMVSLFQTNGDLVDAIPCVYGEKESEQSVSLKVCGHSVDLHGLSAEQVRNLADALYNAARIIDDKRGLLDECDSVVLPASSRP